MSRARLSLLLAPLLLTTALVGCLGSEEPVTPASLGASATLTVLGGNGTALPGAQITALAQDQVLTTASADANGTLPLAALPAPTTDLVVTAPGHTTWRGALADLPARLTLEPQVDPVPVDPDDPTPVLRFLDPMLMGRAYLADEPTTCEVENCGASEPVIEVASDGTVYVSGTCCIGESPPIWVSRDRGANFERLQGDALRDTFGIEGDFAIDDAGNLYFSDISAASLYFSSWDAQGQHRHTVPAGPMVPLVDRPWVRAGAEDVVHLLYNTGTNTRFYNSNDGGITWMPQAEFPGALGALGQGPERDHLWAVVQATLYESTDGGVTWSSGEPVPTPTEEGASFQAYWVPVVDEAGNLWVVYDWKDAEADQGPYHIYAARRDAGGTWHGPFQVSPDNGTHHLPWPATGAEGSLVVAWYGTGDDDAGPNTVDAEARWFVQTAVTVDGTRQAPSFQVTRADPQPVHEGPMNRKLLDFLQVDIGPEGAIHLAYAQDRHGAPDEATQYVRSTTGLQLQPEVYPNGP